MSLDEQLRKWKEITATANLLRYEYLAPSEKKTELVDKINLLYQAYIKEYGFYDPIEPPSK